MTPESRILICGNYGRQTLNGQTLKTRILRDAFAASLGNRAVRALDTSSAIRKPISFYRTVKREYAEATQIVMLPGRLALPVFLYLFTKWRRQKPLEIRYVVVGGWLPELLARRPRMKASCRQLSGIYVETRSMLERLTAMGFTNVHLLPNFRSFDRRMNRSDVPASPPVKLVFCARVTKDKGIEEAIAAVNAVNAQAADRGVVLDIYGPITKAYQKRFDRLAGRSATITYKGLLGADQLYSVLQQYHLMLFPTYYEGEGFPGSIVDAFIAGLPVLASDWKYNGEIIESGRTGALCRAKSATDLTKALQELIDTPALLGEMRRHCISRALDYHVECALRELLNDVKSNNGPARKPEDH